MEPSQTFNYGWDIICNRKRLIIRSEDTALRGRNGSAGRSSEQMTLPLSLVHFDS